MQGGENIKSYTGPAIYIYIYIKSNTSYLWLRLSDYLLGRDIVLCSRQDLNSDEIFHVSKFT